VQCLVSISSHAQAEALVLPTQQSILDMDGTSLDDKPSIGARSPLSAILAACGKSLALERRLQRAEEETKVGKDIVKDIELSVSPTFILDAGRLS
jgi:hypothetical protein